MAYLRSKGKTVIANGPHYTRTMSGWGLQCFVESAPEDNAVVGAHLSHPLCLTDYSNPDPRTQCDIARRLLDRAGISFAAFAIEAPMFPITPIELRAGVVIGEERTGLDDSAGAMTAPQLCTFSTVRGPPLRLPMSGNCAKGTRCSQS